MQQLFVDFVFLVLLCFLVSRVSCLVSRVRVCVCVGFGLGVWMLDAKAGRGGIGVRPVAPARLTHSE
jgi:hypothetical protein